MIEIDKADIIEVKDSVARDLIAVAARQAILLLVGGVLVKSLGIDLPAGVAEGVAAGLIVAGTVAYGQFKAWRDKTRALALAENAEIGRVVR